MKKTLVVVFASVLCILMVLPFAMMTNADITISDVPTYTGDVKIYYAVDKTEAGGTAIVATDTGGATAGNPLKGSSTNMKKIFGEGGSVANGGVIVVNGKFNVGVAIELAKNTAPVIITAQDGDANYTSVLPADVNALVYTTENSPHYNLYDPAKVGVEYNLWNGSGKASSGQYGMFMMASGKSLTINGTIIFDKIVILNRAATAVANPGVFYIKDGASMVIKNTVGFAEMAGQVMYHVDVAEGGYLYLDKLGFDNYTGAGTIVIGSNILSDVQLQGRDAIFSNFTGNIVKQDGTDVFAVAETTAALTTTAAPEDTTATDDSGTSGIDGNITWSLSDDGILTITGNGDMSDYGTGTMPWRNLKSRINKVVITDGVTSIGNYAFYNCTRIKDISIPDSVTSIGNRAFAYCTSIVFVSIPDSVTNISDYAFHDCTSLVRVYIPDGVTKIGERLFSNCGSLVGVSIPNSVTSIGQGAFSSCGSLESISIPSSVTRIGRYAFNNCWSLESISIPSSVTSIGDYAFYFCKNLTSISISDSVTSIGQAAFRACSSLKSISIPSGITSISDYVFESCTSLKSISIPLGITSIGQSAFNTCSSLESIIIPEGVASIGDAAFAYCNKLKNISISSSVVSIGKTAFYYCRSIDTIVIPLGVTSIGDNTFASCQSLDSISIPTSVTSIGQNAFSNCNNLWHVLYEGTEAQWNAMSIDSSNSYLTGATRHYSSNGDEVTSSITAQPTCTAQGCITYTCSVCAGSKDTVLGMLAHSGTISSRVEPNCTTMGYDVYLCDVCKRTYNMNYVSPLGHSGNVIDVIAPGCVDKGYTRYLCNVCDMEYTSELKSPLGHSFSSGICSNCGMAEEDCIESEHNYQNNSDVSWTITKEAAKRIAITFSNESIVERGYDYIYIYDGADNLIGKYTGDELASVRIVVLSSSVRIRLTSDGNNTYYGFALSKVEAYYEDCIHEKTSRKNASAPSCTSDGYSGDVICDECLIVVISGESVSAVGHSFADDVCQNCSASIWNYFVSNNEVIITGHKEPVGELSIPATIDGYPVGSISNSAFYNCTNITGITIAEGVTEIIGFAFYNCTNLTRVALPSTLESIGECAFERCTGLVSISIPSSVVNIDNSAFLMCYGLKSVYISDLAAWVGISFSGAASNPIHYAADLYLDGEKLVELEIPSGVSSIGNYAFYNCTSIESVSVPSSVSSIGDYAFYNCHSLENVAVPSSVSSIGSYTFYNCTSLVYVSIPLSVSSIGSYAFYNCIDLWHVLYSGNEQGWNDVNINPGNDSLVNADCHFGTASECITISVTAPTCDKPGTKAFLCGECENSKTVIELEMLGHLFEGNTCSVCSTSFVECLEYSITDGKATIIGCVKSRGALVLPDEINGYPVVAIGDEVFMGFSELTSITIPDGVTDIGRFAFANCAALVSVDLSSSLTNIGHMAFSSCVKLVSISLPDSIRMIGESAFNGCDSLTGALYDNAYYIGNEDNPYLVLLRAKDKNITSCQINEATRIIYCTAFYNCSSMQSVTMPDGLIGIGVGSFKLCSSLVSISIPETVEYIGESAFWNCESLEVIDYNAVSSTKMLYGGKGGGGYMPVGVFYKSGNSLSGVVLNIGANVENIMCLEGCYIKRIEVDGNNKYYCSDADGILYNKEMTSLICFPSKSEITKYEISDKITEIGPYAFSYNDRIESIVMPDSVNSISLYAFLSATSLKSIVLSENITVIDYGAFYNCTSLESVNIPSGVTSICPYAFYNCTSLESIDIPSSVTSIAWDVFHNCTNLESVTIPLSVTSIDYDVFDGCPNITINVFSGSYAHQYVVDNDYPFLLIVDIDGDGEMNNSDITLLVRHLVGWDVGYDMTYADITGDGKLNNRDIIAMIRRLAFVG